MKTVLVTGASRGIGRAVAEAFYGAGCKVAAICKNNIDLLDDRFLKIRADVSDPDEVRRVFSEVEKNFGRLDVLVNNAGISVTGLLTDLSDDDWKRICGVNLDGVLWCSREAARIMVRQKEGCIINISSMWGQCGASCEVAYSATKGGVDALTKALAKELAPSNIQVNAVSPGVIDTEMNGFLSEEDRNALAEEIPAGRFGKPSEVADLVLKLASGNGYLTGQIIRIDGGFV